MEAEQPRMEAETMQRVVTVTVLWIATDRMPHIGRVHTDLILTSRL